MVSEEDIKILEKMINEIIEKDDCNLFETLSPLEIALKIKKLLQGYKELKENSIPKSLVEEKIEEYKKRKENCNDLEVDVRLDVKIKAYEELLKGDK